MTSWSTPALLLLGIAAGPHGLNLLSSDVVLLLDPGIALTLAMLGVFVGLSFNPGQRHARVISTSGAKTIASVVAVGVAVLALSSYLQISDSPLWILSLMVGACAAVSESSSDVNVDDVLMIVLGGFIIAVIRAPAAGPPYVLVPALAGISILISYAGWLLVGQTNSEGEQHVFVVGSLLLLGGAATYLSLSAVFTGLVSGFVWNLTGGLSKARIVRDLGYFQHPLVVLVLIAAGAVATISIDAVAVALVFVAVRSVTARLGMWISRRLSDGESRAGESQSLVSGGLIGIALAFDLFRADARPEWAVTLLAAIVIGNIISNAIALFVPARGVPR